MLSIQRSPNRAYAGLKHQFAEVDESYFRKMLNQQSVTAAAHVFSLGNLTLMTNDALQITAAIMRPSALDSALVGSSMQAGTSQNDVIQNKAIEINTNTVKFLLPTHAKPMLPSHLRIGHYRLQMINSLSRAFKPFEKMLASAIKNVSRILNPRPSRPTTKESIAQWHTLRLTTSDLSTNI